MTKQDEKEKGENSKECKARDVTNERQTQKAERARLY
jgi:hypothetical protein